MSSLRTANPSRPRIAIVGAGLCGMSCALELSRRNIDFKLFEKNPVVGGRVRDFSKDGERVALGAFIFSLHYVTLLSLIREMGLEDRVKPTEGGRAIYVRGRILKLNPAAMALDPTIPFGAKIDLAKLMNLVAKLTPDSLPEDTFHVSAKNYFLERYRPEILDDFVNPFCWGYFSGSAETVPAANALRAMSTAYHSHTLEGGLYALAKALEARLADRIVKDCRIDSIAVEPDGGFVLRGGFDAEKFDIVVCCTPVPEARKILPDIAIPDVRYSRKRMYIVKGENAFPGISFLINGDSEFRLGAIQYTPSFNVVSSEQGDPILDPFFRNADVVHEHQWEQCAPKTQGQSFAGPATEIPNLYMTGCFRYGGGTEAASRAGREMAEIILANLAGTKGN